MIFFCGRYNFKNFIRMEKYSILKQLCNKKNKDNKLEGNKIESSTKNSIVNFDFKQVTT